MGSKIYIFLAKAFVRLFCVLNKFDIAMFSFLRGSLSPFRPKKNIATNQYVSEKVKNFVNFYVSYWFCICNSKYKEII